MYAGPQCMASPALLQNNQHLLISTCSCKPNPYTEYEQTSTPSNRAICCDLRRMLSLNLDTQDTIFIILWSTQRQYRHHPTKLASALINDVHWSTAHTWLAFLITRWQHTQQDTSPGSKYKLAAAVTLIRTDCYRELTLLAYQAQMDHCGPERKLV